MTMLNKVAKFVAGVLLVSSISGCASPEIKSGYNALETATTSEGSIRNRALVNKDLRAGNINVGYHALAELDDLDPNTHFGRHGLTAGIDDCNVQGIAVLKTGGKGVTDAKYGIRLRNLGKLGGYGFVDMAADHNSSNLSLFYGRQLGKRTSVEIYEAAEFPFDSNPTSYTEFQVNRSLGNRLSVFGRTETAKFDDKSTKYLFGLAISF